MYNTYTFQRKEVYSVETLEITSIIKLFLATCPDEETEQTLLEIFDENHPTDN